GRRCYGALTAGGEPEDQERAGRPARHRQHSSQPGGGGEESARSRFSAVAARGEPEDLREDRRQKRRGGQPGGARGRDAGAGKGTEGRSPVGSSPRAAREFRLSLATQPVGAA